MHKLKGIIYGDLKMKSLLILASYIGLMVVSAILFSIYIDKESLQATVQAAGPLGVLVYGLVEVIYVAFTPLLNTFVLVASGYIFGGHIGFLINFFSTAVGLFLIILLVKKYGRPLLHRIVSPKFYDRFDHIVQKVGPMTLLVVYVLPLTPDDELTYIVAAGPLGLKRFILPILLGTAAKAAYSYIGDLGAGGIKIAVYFRIVLLIVGVIAVGFQEFMFRRMEKKALLKNLSSS